MITGDQKMYGMKDAGFQTEKCWGFGNHDALFEAIWHQMFAKKDNNIEVKQEHVGKFNSKILNRQFLRLDNTGKCFSFTP